MVRLSSLLGYGWKTVWFLCDIKGHCSIRIGDLDSGGVANLSWAEWVMYKDTPKLEPRSVVFCTIWWKLFKNKQVPNSPLALNLCSQAARRSQFFFQRNHKLGTLDFTGSKKCWNSCFIFSQSTALLLQFIIFRNGQCYHHFSASMLKSTFLFLECSILSIF